MKFLKLMLLVIILTACTEDQKNQFSRKAVEYLNGSYKVTYANGSTAKSWIIKEGKVTSNLKGYYYFWDEKKHYIQTPIENTFIEEIE